VIFDHVFNEVITLMENFDEVIFDEVLNPLFNMIYVLYYYTIGFFVPYVWQHFLFVQYFFHSSIF
jgi:hypothetical protein